MVESSSELANQRYYGRLALPYLDLELKAKHHNHAHAREVFSSFTLNEDYKKQVEQVGSAYEKLKVRVYKQVTREENKSKHQDHKIAVSDSESSSSDTEDTKQDADDHHEEWEKKRKRRTREDIEKEALLMGDLYAILGLGHLTYEAGESDIKSAYKQLALQYHPDKVGEKITQSDKEIWLQIQNAYETLIDQTKRRRYDSSLPFDDNIPDDTIVDINDDNFYEIFEPVFRRNARFAKKKPVPTIGDPTMPIELVHKFFKYWDYFDTWRDFSQYDEYDPREAQDRFERRYMEKENKKMRDKYMKKERARIIKMVELAYKYDPRIKQQRIQEELEKQRKKQEMRDRREKERLEAEEKQRLIDEAKQKEIQRQQDEERKIKEEKEVLKKKHKDAIKDLSVLCEERLNDSKYDRFFIEEFCKKIKVTEEIELITSQLKQIKDSETCKGYLESIIKQHQETHEQQKQQSKKEEDAKKKEEQKKGDWTLEELSTLSKAIVKYPGAIANRWKLITDFVGTDKTQKQVIAKAQELAQKTSLAKAGKTVVSSTYDQKQKKEEQKKQPNAVKQQTQQPVKKQQEEEKKSSPIKAQEATESDWTTEQQKQLEDGMREFPGSIPVKERWLKIAEKVDGKTAKECYERFKEICALVKKKQEDAAAAKK